MSRTLTAGLAAHYATGKTSLARCLRLDLVDGTSFGITTLDQDIDVDLGDGVLTYEAGTGATPSAVALSLGFEADNLEVSGPVGSLVTRAGVLGGRYRGARARLFEVRFDSPTHYARLLSGKVYNSRIEAGAFVFGLRSHVAAYNQTIGRVISPYCNADFGDARCGATPLTFAATVASVVSDTTFTVTWTGATPTGAQALAGLVTFDTGALAGTLPIELFSLSGTTLSLYQSAAELPQVGDTLTLTEGCDKLRATCVTKLGDAATFRGFPDLTGTDGYVKYPVPGG